MENLSVGVEDEVILEVTADFLVASRDRDGEGRRRAGFDGDIEIHRESCGVESRAQIGRRGWERQMQRGWTASLLLVLLLRHSSLALAHSSVGSDLSACSRVLITASSVASRTTGGWRSGFSFALWSSCAVPLKRSPRWNAMV